MLALLWVSTLSRLNQSTKHAEFSTLLETGDCQQSMCPGFPEVSILGARRCDDIVGILGRRLFRLCAVGACPVYGTTLHGHLESQRKKMGVQMLDRISEVQMVHNRQKNVAMHELLDDGKADQASTVTETCTDM
jgi:hypothetical protein